jgi:Flavin-binding monooxygenase-like
MKQRQRVAVVGAGMSGLVAAKELLDEGHEIALFEEQAILGGNFSTGAGYERMKLTVSNYFMAFSSLPPPLEQERRYWAREEYVEYLNRFADHFGLRAHVHFNARVVSIRREGEAQFRVAWQTPDGSKEEVFSAVAVCRGAHRTESPRVIGYEGERDYRGQILHTAAWDGPERFRGKRVVCVGMGETSADITKEISEVAERCWLSMRSYPRVIPRWRDGHTNDAWSTRIAHRGPEPERKTPEQIARALGVQVMTPRDRVRFEWSSKAELGKFLQKNDDFLDNVITGQIIPIFSDIKRLDGTRVVFENGESVEADTIMLCTGYKEEGIPEGWIAGFAESDVRNLFKHTFHPDLGWRVAFIGWARPAIGGVPACSEMQSRLFALLCSGARSLPNPVDMSRVILADKEAESDYYDGNRYMRTLVQYTLYLDDLADLVGCKPDLTAYLDDPELLFRLLFGSNISACYRLRGPHADPEAARKLILHLPVATPRPEHLAKVKEVLREYVGESLVDRVQSLIEPYLATTLARGTSRASQASQA